MHFQSTAFGLIALASVAKATSAETIKVTVGENGQLAFNPNNIIAPVGTKVEFSFFPKNHTVTQSSFSDPCHPLSSGGFFSGFVPTTASPSGTTFTIQVTDPKPIWFYCSQTVGSHCQKGMVGAINAPTSGNTLEKFITLAKNATVATSPSVPGVGGTLVSAGSPSGNGTVVVGPGSGHGNGTFTMTVSPPVPTEAPGAAATTISSTESVTLSTTTTSPSTSATASGAPQLTNGSERALSMSAGSSMVLGLAVVFVGMSLA